jgi:hypothetical protein
MLLLVDLVLGVDDLLLDSFSLDDGLNGFVNVAINALVGLLLEPIELY